MHIAIKNFARFRKGCFRTASRDYPCGTVVGQVLRDLELLPDALGAVLLNGCRSHLEQLLYDGDVLSLLPAAGAAAPFAHRTGGRGPAQQAVPGPEGARR